MEERKTGHNIVLAKKFIWVFHKIENIQTKIFGQSNEG